MEHSDAELLLGCRRGDEAAWGAIIERYQRLIYAIPTRAGLNKDEAADVFQEVLTTLFEKLHDIDQPERLQAWLVTTARRKTWRAITRRNSLPSSGEHQEGNEDELMRQLPDTAPLADAQLIRLEEQHRVRTAIAALDERCRKLLTLLFYAPEMPPYAEVAAALGTTEGSIGPTRARCLQKLMRLLES
ncbi:MAG: RNA polymerase sigma factor [Pyrinomonadaceae bacterium]